MGQDRVDPVWDGSGQGMDLIYDRSEPWMDLVWVGSGHDESGLGWVRTGDGSGLGWFERYGTGLGWVRTGWMV